MADLRGLRGILSSERSTAPEKMRALFTLRNVSTAEAAGAIEGSFSDPSILIRHEAAYILGQMLFEQSIPGLIRLLTDEAENEIVRHEAGEALGNFCMQELAPVLRRYLNHSSVVISETCRLALDKTMTMLSSPSRASRSSEFGTEDPSFLPHVDLSVSEASKTFLDCSAPLCKRYEAMFSLRNINSDEAALILARGFGDKSSLLKHEVAFVLGQMGKRCAVGAMGQVMSDTENQHEMVRHEVALALGSVGSREAEEILLMNADDPNSLVRESVEVALDTLKYVRSDRLEYCMV